MNDLVKRVLEQALKDAEDCKRKVNTGKASACNRCLLFKVTLRPPECDSIAAACRAALAEPDYKAVIEKLKVRSNQVPEDPAVNELWPTFSDYANGWSDAVKFLEKALK